MCHAGTGRGDGRRQVDPMDVNGSATLATSLPLGNTTGWANADFPIFASASTNIIFNTTLTACTAGTAKYRVYVGMDKPT
jgi:hypothetical protein